MNHTQDLLLVQLPRKNIEENARLETTNKEVHTRGRENVEIQPSVREFSKKNTVGNGFTLVTTAEKKGGEMIYVQAATTYV